ncbi:MULTISPECIES: S8 family serine peptidase [unclassified Bradyrhizobium]|uniref:S8 family serine peptidase n=1 Tax=unclassified Bradyrhizobium TaxID=2631580 RepID=UPI0028E89DB6|nr:MULTISPECIES: S8 family serine peptidase [unclassified Bradyrhizobium]
MFYESGRTEDIPDRWREAAQFLIFDPVAGGRHELHVQQPAAAAEYEFKPASTIAQTPHGPAEQIDPIPPAPSADAPSGAPGLLAHNDAEATVVVQLVDVSTRAQTPAQEAAELTARTVAAGWQVTEPFFHPSTAIAGNASVGPAHAGQSTSESGFVLSISVEMWSGASASLQTWSFSSLGKPATAQSGPSGEPAPSLQDAVTEAIASAVSAQGATSAQVVQALGGNSTGVTGAGIKIGVLSSSFNNLGGAAADEASGALPSASKIQILKDMPSGGTDEGRAMMQVIHDIAPDASLAFYTAFQSEQDFADGIIALANAGCKVIVDDVSYSDEPFFQNGVVAQAIQTVQAMGVTYVTSAGNNGSTAYQTSWTSISGSIGGMYYDGNALSFGGNIAQTITVTAGANLLVQWDQAWGQAASHLSVNVYQNGQYLGHVPNSYQNPWIGLHFAVSGTYQIVIADVFGPTPSTIKEILAGNGLPVSISGANVGTVFGHAMTPGVITVGAVNAANTPAFGTTPVSESFSSSGAGTEILFANDGTRLATPLQLSPVVVSGIDNISTTVTGMTDFYGTSAAAPSVAAIAALILTANPTLSYADVSEILQQTAVPMANPAVAGAGLAQIDPAVGSAPYFANTIVEALGSISLAQVGVIYDLNTIGGSTTVALRYNGANVVVHWLSDWTPIGAEANGNGGYEVAWKLQGQDLYTVWNVDGSGNYKGNAIGGVSGSSTALETFETSFHQDLNGDGTIGLVSIVIEALGSTSLVQAGNGYFLNPVAGGSGPQLKFNGSAVAPGQLGGWTPIAAEAAGGGYQVAWKMAGSDLYTLWNVDSSGNYTGNAIGGVSGGSAALEAFETSLHQDLNGDGTIGVPTTVIEAVGSTVLVQTGNGFSLNPVGGGAGPQLKFGGTSVVAGQLGGWAPIAAEASGNGYQVAWKMAGADLYTVWNTDSSGNYTTNAIGAVAGGSAALEAFEASFHQDLNGDGTTGIPTTVIEAVGSTNLVQIGNGYYLNPVGGGIGPQIKFGGSVVTVGQTGGWDPIGAEASVVGYLVAWKMAGTDLYTVWNTDGSGAYVSNAIGAVSGGSAALETLEASFHQDLNGDGTIGIPASNSAVTATAVTANTSGGANLMLAAPSFSGNLVALGSTAAQIDLQKIAFASLQTHFDEVSGVLSPSDGTSSSSLQFVGALSQDNFQFAGDGLGGSLNSGAAAQAAGVMSEPVSLQGHDTFVFAAHFGQVRIDDFALGADKVVFTQSLFADQSALQAAIHDDTAGNAVITDAALDAIMVKHVSTAELLSHLSSFHIV